MNWTVIQEKLQAPFNYSDIKFRIQQPPKGDVTEGSALVLAYVSNRAIQRRFDDVFGPGGWKNEFKEWQKPLFDIDIDKIEKHTEATKYKTSGAIALSVYKEYLTQSQLCGISVWDDDKKEWITKWDSADETNFEGTKGGLSDSMKRAAYHWGVGRYLYELKATYTEVKRKDKYSQWYIVQNPELPAWAYDQGVVQPSHISVIRQMAERKGYKEDVICSKYFKSEYGELTMIEFTQAIKSLDKCADVKDGEEPRLKGK